MIIVFAKFSLLFMKSLIYFLTILFCFSCGVKGPPLPPVKSSLSQKEELQKDKQSNQELQKKKSKNLN